MCEIWIDDPVTLLSDRRVTARKEHRCHECRRVIARGEGYSRETWIFDGEMDSAKTCAHCRAVRDVMHRTCGGFSYGGLEPDMSEVWPDFGFSGGRALIGMRRQWQRNGSLMPIPHLTATEEPK